MQRKGKPIVWNQLGRPINDTYYYGQSSAATFEDGISTMVHTANYSRLSIRANYMFPVQANHVYMIMVYTKRNYTHYGYSIVTNMGGTSFNYGYYDTTNDWILSHLINRTSTTAFNYMYFGDVQTYVQSGDITKVKNIMIFDFTQMFGEGNEPTTYNDFEQICSRNGVDLSQYQDYDLGTIKYWDF